MYLNLKLSHDFDNIVTRKTVLYVGAVHVVLIIVLYLSGFIQNLFWDTTPQAISVTLAGGPPALQGMSAQQPAAASSQKQPHHQVHKKKTEKTKESKAAQKVPTKKSWKPLDISQITRSTETTVEEVKPTKQTTASTNSVSGLSASALAANLKNSLSSIKFGSTNGGGSGQANPAILSYYDSISSFLYEKWEQPSRLAVSGEPPSVLVKLTIGPDGRLMNYKIIQNSTLPEMNKSVKEMLESVKRLPAPPNGAITIEATLILTN